jgi:hypothetical protein
VAQKKFAYTILRFEKAGQSEHELYEPKIKEREALFKAVRGGVTILVMT